MTTCEILTFVFYVDLNQNSTIHRKAWKCSFMITGDNVLLRKLNMTGFIINLVQLDLKNMINNYFFSMLIHSIK
jgi:hypothetical protein